MYTCILQPIAEKVAQNLELFQKLGQHTRILPMGLVGNNMVLIWYSMRILVNMALT